MPTDAFSPEPRPRVLIIEDDVAQARLLEHYLKRAKPRPFQCEHASRLADGLQRLAESPFDAVLVDLGLPDSSGLESLDAIRTAHPSVPAIVMTGNEDEHLALQAVECGAQDYIVKRHSSSELIGRSLQYAIEHRRLQEQLRRRPPLPDGPGSREFQNLLRTIHTAAREALQQLAPDAPSRPELEQVLRASAEATELTRQLFAQTSETSA